jgi:hypothetical protein
MGPLIANETAAHGRPLNCELGSRSVANANRADDPAAVHPALRATGTAIVTIGTAARVDGNPGTTAIIPVAIVTIVVVIAITIRPNAYAKANLCGGRASKSGDTDKTRKGGGYEIFGHGSLSGKSMIEQRADTLLVS